MSHDGPHLLGAIAAAAYVTTVAGAPQIPMSDEQVLVTAIGSGLMGGLVSALMADGDLTRRVIATRMLACGMVSPSLVAAGIVYAIPSPSMLMVGALSGVAGMVAWPVATILPKLAPQALRKWFKSWIGGGDA